MARIKTRNTELIPSTSAKEEKENINLSKGRKEKKNMQTERMVSTKCKIRCLKSVQIYKKSQ